MRNLLFIFLGLLLPVIGCSGRSESLSATSQADTPSYDTGWHPDILGDDYTMRYVNQGRDYLGDVRSTIIKLPVHSGCDSTRGILYVHGFNDYFLQKDMGERFADSCWRFFAVDLRRYGRSLEKGQRLFEVRSMHEYFADIDSGIAEMKREGVKEIVVLGHSTGGLTTSLYLNYRHDPAIKGLILNSPFLDWNQSKFQEKILIPVVSFIGRFWHSLTALPGTDPIYSRPDSLNDEGPWGIIRAWKPREWPSLDAGWIHAIHSGQRELRRDSEGRGGSRIEVPVLLLLSDRSFHKGMAESMRDSTDDVLDVRDISRYGRELGPDVTEVVIPGGVHDLVRSTPQAREAAYRAIFNFLDTIPG